MYLTNCFIYTQNYSLNWALKEKS